jgi:WD repeat-containing protein 7
MDAGIASLSDEETMTLADKWAHHRPLLFVMTDCSLQMLSYSALRTTRGDKTVVDGSLGVADLWLHRYGKVQSSLHNVNLNPSSPSYVRSTRHYSTLADASKSIAAYLHDERSPYRVLAIDLCARGFETWQHYVDAMALLRRLFTLATATAKDSISPQNVGPQARLAVLKLAGTSTPLFMTTLSLEILHPQSIPNSKAVMQMVAFLIRKVLAILVYIP